MQMEWLTEKNQKFNEIERRERFKIPQKKNSKFGKNFLR